MFDFQKFPIDITILELYNNSEPGNRGRGKSGTARKAQTA